MSRTNQRILANHRILDGRLAERLTLLDLLWGPIGTGLLRPIFLGLAGLGLVFPRRLLHRPWLWFALATAAAVRVLRDWPLADNHAYLLVYWLLAIGLAATRPQPDRALARMARWMLGLVFLFALLWKGLLAPDFRDGRFFRYTMLTDPRFEGFTRLVGGLSEDGIEALRAELSSPAESGVDGPGPEPARLRAVAVFATWWTLGIEALVALGFLWPVRRGPRRLGHASLLLFCASTYAVATVAGFAWLLLAMGLAQLKPDQRRWRAAYVACFVLVLAYRELPWAHWLLSLQSNSLAVG